MSDCGIIWCAQRTPESILSACSSGFTTVFKRVKHEQAWEGD